MATKKITTRSAASAAAQATADEMEALRSRLSQAEAVLDQSSKQVHALLQERAQLMEERAYWANQVFALRAHMDAQVQAQARAADVTAVPADSSDQ